MIMESPDETLCTNCGEKTAVFFMHCISSGEKESVKLCEACLEATGPALLKDYMTAMKNANCCYCGGKAMTGGSTMDVVLGRSERRFMCRSCFEEHNRFLLPRFQALADVEEKSVSEQMRQIRDLDEEEEDHMKRWVIQRYN